MNTEKSTDKEKSIARYAGMSSKKNSRINAAMSSGKKQDSLKKKPVSGYELKTEAIDALVEADRSNTPSYSMEELSKYRTRRLPKLPGLVKIMLLKAWFYGAVCFFFLWGLGTYLKAMLDMLFIIGIAMGIVTDLLINGIIRFMEETPGANSRYMMFPKKKFATFFYNIIYSYVVLFCVYMTYYGINYGITSSAGTPEDIPIGVGPILFGLFAMFYDSLFVGLKNRFLVILEDAKKQAGGNR